MSGIKSFLQALHDCLAALILLFLTASAVTAQVNTTDKDVPVQIRLTPDKNTIMLGEPLFFAVDVTNLSGEKFCLGVGGDYRNRFGRPESFSVSVKDGDGKTLPQFEVINMGGLSGCGVIEPGETYTFRLFLADWAKIERPGSYQIDVARNMAFSSWESGARNPKYSIKAHLSAEFTVVPADENKMGGVINALGSLMLDIGDPHAVESATALASIQDKRTISYFAEALRKFGGVEVNDPFARQYTIVARSIVALGTYDDDRAIEALRDAMNSSWKDTRLNIASVFRDSPHKSAIKLMLEMQNDEYWFVRLRVAQGLKNIKTNEALAALQKLLKDEVEDVRNAAKESLN